MATAESNIFPVLNLGDLTSTYKLYRAKGLDRDHPLFYQNCDEVARRTSYLLKTPALVIERDGAPHLVVPAEAPDPPGPMLLVTAQAAFERVPGTFELNFAHRSAETDAICTRFLQFAVQGRLHDHPDLWQPSSGRPFYEKRAEGVFEAVGSHRGFSVRAMSRRGLAEGRRTDHPGACGGRIARLRGGRQGWRDDHQLLEPAGQRDR